MDRNWPAGRPACGAKTRHFIGRGNRRGQVVVGQEAVFLGQKRTEHQYRPPRPQFAQRRGLGHVGHRKEIRAGMHQPRGGLGKPVAIGVGLHHRHVTDMSAQRSADQAQIAIERGEIDLGPAAGPEQLALSPAKGLVKKERRTGCSWRACSWVESTGRHTAAPRGERRPAPRRPEKVPAPPARGSRSGQNIRHLLLTPGLAAAPSAGNPQASPPSPGQLRRGNP